MATPTYEDVLQGSRQLRTEEQLALLEALASMLRQTMTPHPRRSILELQGLGKQSWHEIDAQEYVNREREVWNGYLCTGEKVLWCPTSSTASL